MKKANFEVGELVVFNNGCFPSDDFKIGDTFGIILKVPEKPHGFYMVYSFDLMRIIDMTMESEIRSYHD